MKSLLSILFISINICVALDYNLEDLLPSSTPVYYAMLKDFSPPGSEDSKAIIYVNHISHEIEDFLASSDNGGEEEMLHNLEIIDLLVNRNYNFLEDMKTKIEKDLPDIDKVLKISEDGYTCDQKFCDEFGDGHHAIGICTPYSCVCTIFGPEGMKCDDALYYDPVFESCDLPQHVRICGL